jgi:hypothetical protein
MGAAAPSDGSHAEAERQLAAAAERHREVVASLGESGRPEAGQHVAVKSVGRAVHLVSFSLKRAADAGVPFERLVELTGWEPDLVRAGLELKLPEPRFVARLSPPGTDARAVAEAAALYEAIARVQGLTQRLLADVDGDAAVSAPEVDDLHDRLEAGWRSWRENRTGRPESE